jgi:predicted metal-dependent phosphotriesterase family hydrolase
MITFTQTIMITRREFIKRTILTLAGTLGAAHGISGMRLSRGKILLTVLGSIPSKTMGFTLTHEHILVDFIGAEKYSKDRYNQNDAYDAALPHLRKVRSLGCSTFVDCSPAYLGRDVNLLKRLAESTGLNIVTNTGYYGASEEKYLPRHTFTESAQQLADRWIKEFNEGIESTSIRPGFIKTGVDNAPLTATQRKLIEAAGMTHLKTGLAIAVHTGDGKAADEQLDILEELGVSPRARIWVHAQNEEDSSYHVRAARRDSWVSLDGINPESVAKHLTLLQTLKKEKLLHRVLLSQDSGWYRVGEPGGGQYNHYNYILEQFIPLMKTNGFTSKEIDTIFHDNPAEALSIQVRRK